jgi:hypothetical protein
MKKFLTSAVLAASFAGLSATTAMAAQCAERNHVVAQLDSRFGEVLAYTGLGRDRHIVEVYASSQTQRWTLTVATPDGLSCVLATGTGAKTLAMKLGQPVTIAQN